MQVNDRQPTEAREMADTQEGVDLKRTAHKIAWARMNGTINTTNPFVAADSDRFAPGELTTLE